jgi:NADPH:quinone reductase-like Zn-dependent oxidoreductase
MHAITFNQPGDWQQNLYLTRQEIREPLPSEVQVKVMARPINPADQMFINGSYRLKPALPQIAGLEGAGIIQKAGENISKSLLGMHVSFLSAGTWAESINLQDGAFRIVPKEIPFETACQLSLNTLTAYGLLEGCGLLAGQWLVLTAANSSICRLIIQMAKLRQINILALVRGSQYASELLALGATECLNIENEGIEDRIMEITQGGASAILDAVGGQLGSKLINVTAPFAKIIIYGVLSMDNVSFHNRAIVYKNLKIEGFGIRQWLNSKSASELNEIWKTITTGITKKRLVVRFDSAFELSAFKEAISHYQNTGEKTILVS